MDLERENEIISTLDDVLEQQDEETNSCNQQDSLKLRLQEIQTKITNVLEKKQQCIDIDNQSNNTGSGILLDEQMRMNL